MRRLLVMLGGAVAFVVGLASTAGAQTTYPINVGGIQVSRAGAATNVSGASGSLAFTGVNHLLTYILVGFGLLAVGLVLVLAARRRTQLLQRA
jgi:hypothetical protein